MFFAFIDVNALYTFTVAEGSNLYEACFATAIVGSNRISTILEFAACAMHFKTLIYVFAIPSISFPTCRTGTRKSISLGYTSCHRMTIMKQTLILNIPSRQSHKDLIRRNFGSCS